MGWGRTKPPPGAGIAWGSPLADRLLWAVAPGPDNARDLIDGQQGTILNSSTLTGQTPIGQALDSPDTTNGGMSWPWTDRLTQLSTRWTILVWAVPMADGFSWFLDIPYRATGWTAPFGGVGLGYDGTNDRLFQHMAYDASHTDGAMNSGTSSLTSMGLTELAQWVVTRDEATVKFYRNAVQIGTDQTEPGNNALDLSGKQPIVVLGRSSTSLGESLQGRSPFAAIWARPLRTDELLWLLTEPYALIAPPPRRAPSAADVLTNASAGLASGTGAAFNAAASLKPTGGLATGTGGASNAAVSTGSGSAPASVSTGTGTAPTASASVFASATGAVSPGLGVNSGVALGVGQAFNQTTPPNAPAITAVGSGIAGDATTKGAPAVGVAAATGTAYDAGGGGVVANAELAEGVGGVGARASVDVGVGVAAGTGTAGDPLASVMSIGAASGTGTALNATTSAAGNTSASAVSAAGAGLASNVTASLGPTAGSASGTGAAFNATVASSGNTNAPAGNAAGTGTAFTASSLVVTSVGSAAGAGAANNAAGSVRPSAGNAAGSGNASSATVITNANALAGLASGTGTGFGGAGWIKVTANAVTGVGQAYDAVAESPRVGGRGPTGSASGSVPVGSAASSRPVGRASSPVPVGAASSPVPRR